MKNISMIVFLMLVSFFFSASEVNASYRDRIRDNKRENTKIYIRNTNDPVVYDKDNYGCGKISAKVCR